MQIGVDLPVKQGRRLGIVHAIEAHPRTCARPLHRHLGARRRTISRSAPKAPPREHETYIKRTGKLEGIASETPGVSSSYAIRGAGREIRIIVNPDKDFRTTRWCCSPATGQKDRG